MAWLTRLRNVFRSDSVSDEIDREMAFHLAERTDDLVAGGLTPDEARDEARRRFGRSLIQKENTRERDLLIGLETLIADLQYGLRTLRAAPGFAAVAILSLALGIGANTAIFTLINIAMLESLPVRDPEELVELTITGGQPAKGPAMFSQPLWEQIRDHQDVFSGVFAYGSTGSADLSSGGEARRIAVGLVTGGFFSTLGVRPTLGRLLVDADDRRGCPAVAVITHAFWQREYGGAETIVGRSVPINSHPFEIVGVADPAFIGLEFGYDAPVWAPQCTGTIIRGAGGYSGGGMVVGRLKPGITLDQVRARMAALTPVLLEATLPANASAEAAARHRRVTFGVAPFAKGIPFLNMQYGEALWMLMGIVAVVLLVACANVANLLLARAAARQREIAVRMALGASRFRVIRQRLTESLQLSFAGAALGVLFAGWGSRALVGFLSRQDQALPLDLMPDSTVLTFTIALSVLTGVIFGLAPAWRAARLDPYAAMKPGGRGVCGGDSRFGAGKALVVAQIALSLVMIVCAGLLLGSWRRLATLDPGFRAAGVLLTSVNTRPARIPADRVAETYRRLLERLRAIPGVAVASAAGLTPLGSGSASIVIDVEGYTPSSDADATVIPNPVSDRYFETIGTRMLAGRDFGTVDTPGSPPVAIVNEALARKFFGGVDRAHGRSFRVRAGQVLLPPIEIVGVVANTKEHSLREEDRPIVYEPLGQITRPWTGISFALRANGVPAAALSASVKGVMAEIDPRLSFGLRTLQDQLDESVRLPRTLGLLSGFFGGLALLLAAIGLYGIMSYTVARRRGEIGVRIALGAARAGVMRMVFGDVSRIAAAGLVIGALVSAGTTQLVSRFLFGVTPQDPATFAVSALLLAAVAIGAAAIPARRAARLDPVATLREE